MIAALAQDTPTVPVQPRSQAVALAGPQPTTEPLTRPHRRAALDANSSEGDRDRGTVSVEASTRRAEQQPGPGWPEGLPTDDDLTNAARMVWPQVPSADAAAAIEGGMLAAAQAQHTRARSSHGAAAPVTEPARVAGAITAVAALQRDLSTPAAGHTTGFGVVVPVMAASPGCGGSVLAALLTDTLADAGRAALLVDTADPARSGLALAAAAAGPWVSNPHPRLQVRFSLRGRAVMARLHTALPVLAPGAVPAPWWWRPPVPELHATVVDLAWDSWRLAAHPLVGAGAWLRTGPSCPRPVLAVRPTRPSLLHAEQVLARLEPWVVLGAAAAPVQMAVMGARRWPDTVAATAGPRVRGLLPHAVFVPHVPALAAAGITECPLPSRLRCAARQLLARLELVPPPSGLRARITPGRTA